MTPDARLDQLWDILRDYKSSDRIRVDMALKLLRETKDDLRNPPCVERLCTQCKTAIAEIAGQKLCHEMEHPDDGDYQFAYEELIRVARVASDSMRT